MNRFSDSQKRKIFQTLESVSAKMLDEAREAKTTARLNCFRRWCVDTFHVDGITIFETAMLAVSDSPLAEIAETELRGLIELEQKEVIKLGLKN